MATAVTLTGTILLPDGTAPQGGQLRFQLTATDTDQTTRDSFAIGGSSFIDLEDGAIPAGTTIWPNTAGLAGSSYDIYHHWIDAEGRKQQRVLAARRTVSDESDTVDIAELIDAGVTAPDNTYVMTITVDEYNAVIEAEANVVEIAAEFGDLNVTPADMEEKVGQAAASAELAAAYAQQPEDQTVSGGAGFSALHHAAKAAASASAASGYADTSETAATAAQDAQSQAETAAANAQASALTLATWSALSTLTGSTAGQGAEVLDSDTGTHTDPVVGGTVNNAGRYTWSASPAGWRRIGGTGLSAKANQADLLSAAVWYGSAVGGTADAITVTASGAPAAMDGLRVKFRAAFDNTGAATLALNGGSAYGVKVASGGNLSAGDIKAGYIYEAQFIGGGNSWRISHHPQDRAVYRQIYAKASAVGGTANAVTVTADMPVANGLLLWLIPTATSTGPATLAYNGGTPQAVLRRGQLIPAGTLVAGRGVLLRYLASGGNPWEIVADGVTAAEVEAIASDLAALDTRVLAVEAAVGVGQFSDEAEVVQNALNSRNPATQFTWSGGVRTRAAALQYRIGGFGSSVGLGAGSGDGAVYAPSVLLQSALTKAFANIRNVEFLLDNLSVGGSSLPQFLGQMTGSSYTDHKIWLGVVGMNDFGWASMDGGQTFPAQDDYLIAQIAQARTEGAMPVICTCPHPHVDRYPSTYPSTIGMQWPYSSYNVTTTHTFDATAKTISGPFSNATYGGQMLTAGEKLVVASGACAGTYTVVSVSGNTVTVAEAIPSTTSYSVQVRHIPLDTERHLWPATSDMIVARDWTGSGVEVEGLATYQIGNQMLRQVCAAQDVCVLDVEKAFFRGVEALGYDGMYDNPNYNHPNAVGYQRGFGIPIAKLVQHIHDGTLKSNRVIW